MSVRDGSIAQTRQRRLAVPAGLAFLGAILAAVLAVTYWDGNLAAGVTISEQGSASESADVVSLAFTHIDPTSQLTSLYAATEDGRSVSLVRQGDSVIYRDVVWSPDGEWLFYTSGLDVGSLSLSRVRPDGTQASEIANSEDGSIGYPIVSPDAQSVAFARELDDGSATVWVSSADGQSQRLLASVSEVGVNPTFACSQVSPDAATPEQWSPDGSRLLVKVRAYGCEVEFSRIISVDVTSDRIDSIIADGGTHPRWSPSGAEVVLDSAEGGLEIRDRTDGKRRHLTPGFTPAWARSGDVAFVRPDNHEDPRSYALWVATGADRARTQLVTKPGLRIDAPKWSRSSDRLAFLGLHESGSTLWTIDLAGGEPVQVAGPDDGYIITFDYAGGR